MKKNFQAALFDLDGVVLDTESQYTEFWGQMGREYRPDVPVFCQRIKGQTLRQIFDAWIPDSATQEEITHRLDQFESQMSFEYIKGTRAYVEKLQRAGVKTAIVTSSNQPKMESVYRTRPELKTLFNRIMTSEDFTESKPSPQCYLRAAAALEVPIAECVVFEDSINGLLSAKASGAYVVGLATTNPMEVIEPLSDIVVVNLEGLDSLDSLANSEK
ncbi:MAG: HAD family phosphatase [Bacteroidaceae bacterium]|nr:HAD family phosphatase [Bacteroidaceae bacterium]